MKTLNTALSLMVLLGLMVLAGCTAGPSLLGLGGHPTAGSGTAMVTIAGWDRQTQAVASDVSTVSVSILPVGGNPVLGQRQEVGSSPGGTASVAFTGLPAGAWRVEATALSASRATIGTATADVVVQAAETAKVTLTLRLAPSHGIELNVGLQDGYVRWNDFFPEASESTQVVTDFANTFLTMNGNQWRFVLTDDTGTRSATYSVAVNPETESGELTIAVEGQEPAYRSVDPMRGIDDLHALPMGATLVATGSETVLGIERPFRKFVVMIRYPYPGNRTVPVTTTRWVAPDLGTYREETVGDAGATTSLVLTGVTLVPRM